VRSRRKPATVTFVT